jgi:hypothetical protein
LFQPLPGEGFGLVGAGDWAWLNADRGRVAGPGRTQPIYAGDSVKLRVHGKYAEPTLTKLNAGTYLTQSAKDQMVDGISELAGGLQRSGSGNPIALLNLANILAGDLLQKEAPEANLIYALYDNDSNRYEVEDRALRNSPVDCFSEGPGCGWRPDEKRSQPA